MEIYNKLVRDNNPKIISAQGKIVKIRILGEEEYKQELLKKLIEESNEALEAKDKEGLSKELGDLLTVIDYVIKAFALDKKEILSFKNEKKRIRGGFDKRIFLESVE